MTQFAAFLGISLLVIVTPGQDTALTIRNTLLGGRRSGVSTAAGVASGQLLWTVAASAGVAALLRASEPAFMAVRLAGAAYLVYLGIQTLRRRGAEVRSRGHAKHAFRQGLLSNLGNPKMAVFFVSLLPQSAGSFSAGLMLGAVFFSMTFAWLTSYAVAVARAGDVLRRPRVRRVVDRLTGTALVGLGLRLATERR